MILQTNQGAFIETNRNIAIGIKLSFKKKPILYIRNNNKERD